MYVYLTGVDKKAVSAKAPRSSAGLGFEKVGSEKAGTASQKVKRKCEVVTEAEKEALKPKKQKVEGAEEPSVKRRRAPSGKAKAANTGACSKDAESLSKDGAKDSDAVKQDVGVGQGSQPAQRAPRKSNIYRLGLWVWQFSMCWPVGLRRFESDGMN